MEIVNMSKSRFNNLDKLFLPNDIMNTEAVLYYIPRTWNKEPKILKKLFNEEGEVFSNKLYTLNTLYDNREKLGVDELVIPSSLASVSGKIVGFMLPYIKNINMKSLMKSRTISFEEKVDYLRQVGEILEKLQSLRYYSSTPNFFVNDIHESNFILNTETNRINIVDLDSCKIGNNLASAAKYLTPNSPIYDVRKYKKNENSIGGVFEITDDTELYCYTVMILNLFYGDNITRLSIEEYFVYLNYLADAKVPKEILDILSYIYTSNSNQNPKDYLTELSRYYGNTHHNTYSAVRKRKGF